MNSATLSNENFVTPHVRIMPKLGHEQWMQKLNKISELYTNAEYETVKHGVRKAAIVHVDQNNMGAMLEKFNRDGMVYTPILKSGLYEGFSHFHKPVEPGDSFYWYGSITRTYDEGQQFKTAELAHDHATIGELLGFPDCCIRYFSAWFPKNYDPVWVKSSGKVVGYPESNTLLRYFGARIVSHISCSPNCRKTRDIGNRWMSIMKSIDKESAADLYGLLSGPMSWNSYHGVVQIETPYFVGVTHTFPYIEKPRIIEWIGGAGA